MFPSNVNDQGLVLARRHSLIPVLIMHVPSSVVSSPKGENRKGERRKEKAERRKEKGRREKGERRKEKSEKSG